MPRSVTNYAKKKIKGIHCLSKKVNGTGRKRHAAVLLDLIDKHAVEIRELYEKKDGHFLVETGDLLVLCLEMLEEFKRSPDVVMEKCYGRYERKLFSLLEQKREKRGGSV